MKKKGKKVFHIRALLRKVMIVYAVLLTLGALAAGTAAYFIVSERDAAESIRSISNAVSWYLSIDQGKELRDAVIEVNSRIGGDEIFNEGDFENMTRFTDMYSQIAEQDYYEYGFLSALRGLNELMYSVESIYLFWYDEANERIVYMVDGFTGESMDGIAYPIGTMESMSRREMKRYDLSVTSRAELEYEGGRRLFMTGAMPWFDREGEIICYIGVDMHHESFILGGLNLILLIMIIMGVLATVITIIILWMSNKATQPIVDVTEAAEKYINRKASERYKKGGYFSMADGGYIYEYRRLVETLQNMENGLGRYIRELTQLYRENERINTELGLARDIQASAVPNAFLAFPERKEFDLYADMKPAREVGGDFYDFYLLDDDHLAIVMADVSGKGIPAALFMMAAKIMIKNRSFFGGTPGEILTNVNSQLCSGNTTDMFVTVWLGILEISSGRLSAANAGHEYPALRRADGQFRLIRDRHGLVLGGMEGFVYETYEIEMHEGDAIYLYTDGVTEAADPDNRLFGTGHMLEALNSAPEAGTEGIIRSVSDSIDQFVREAEQFDDITQLCLTYAGNTGDETVGEEAALTIEAKTENLDRAMAFLDEELEKAGAEPGPSLQLRTAFEELFVNVAHYAYENTGDVEIKISYNDGDMSVQLSDKGKPFDPFTEAKEPDTSLPADVRPIGGLGIYMVKKFMDEYSYRYEDGHNIVLIRKKVRNVGP